MACLLITRDVICVWNDKEVKIKYATPSYTSSLFDVTLASQLKHYFVPRISRTDRHHANVIRASPSSQLAMTYLLPYQ